MSQYQIEILNDILKVNQSYRISVIFTCLKYLCINQQIHKDINFPDAKIWLQCLYRGYIACNNGWTVLSQQESEIFFFQVIIPEMFLFLAYLLRKPTGFEVS